MTSYLANRIKNYNNTVVKETLQYMDAWVRFEFAKSRGQIHGHSIFFSPDHYQRVKEILDRHFENKEKELPEELYKWLQTDDLNGDGLYSPKLVTMHPAGGKLSIDETTWIPNKINWLKEDGGNNSAKTKDKTTLQTDLVEMWINCRRSVGI